MIAPAIAAALMVLVCLAVYVRLHPEQPCTGKFRIIKPEGGLVDQLTLIEVQPVELSDCRNYLVVMPGAMKHPFNQGEISSGTRSLTVPSHFGDRTSAGQGFDVRVWSGRRVLSVGEISSIPTGIIASSDPVHVTRR